MFLDLFFELIKIKEKPRPGFLKTKIFAKIKREKMTILNKITTFLKEVKLEAKKVNWLSRRETLKYTLIVLGVSIGVAVFLGTIDYIMSFLLRKFVI